MTLVQDFDAIQETRDVKMPTAGRRRALRKAERQNFKRLQRQVDAAVLDGKALAFLPFNEIRHGDFRLRIREFQNGRRMLAGGFDKTQNRRIILFGLLDDFQIDAVGFDGAGRFRLVVGVAFGEIRIAVEDGRLVRNASFQMVASVREEAIYKGMFALVGVVVRILRR